MWTLTKMASWIFTFLKVDQQIAQKRKNTLLINQQNNTFIEEAKQYGLDDTGISTQSCFFDFDDDGDLDCIVMNENELYGVDPFQLKKTAG